MKRSILALSLLVFLLIPNCYANTLKLAAVQNVEPLIFEKGGHLTGFDYDIWVELSKRIGVQGDVQLLPFKRLWSYLKSGEIDGTLQIYYKKDREADIVYSKTPMHWSAHYIFVRKEDLPKYSTSGIEALYGKTVGRNAGFFVTKAFDEAVQAGKIKLDEQASSELNLKKLAAGRIDCYVSNLHSAMYAAKQLGLQDKVVPLPHAFAPKKGTYFAVSKKSQNIKDIPAFMQQIDDELAKMHADGTIDRIWSKYSK